MCVRCKRYILISYPISDKIPLYGDCLPPRIKKIKELLKGDTCNTAQVSFCNHTGTHIDAPYHFDENGKKISEYEVKDFIFNAPLLVDLSRKDVKLVQIDNLKSKEDLLLTCDLLLIRTGFCFKRDSDDYSTRNPGIAAATAKWIRSCFPNIRAVGIDSISISPMLNRSEGKEAHRNFLCKDRDANPPLLLLEDLDLSREINQLTKVYAIPLLIEGIDSMSCTVIGELS